MNRPVGITILGALHLFGGSISTIIAAFGFMMIGISDSVGQFGIFSLTLGSVFLIMFGILAVIEFAIAGALFSGRPWGRMIVIILSIIGTIVGLASILGNPFSVLSIVLDGVVLWYMWRPHVITYFRISQTAYQEPREQKDLPLDILKNRYAKGEISKEEFERIKEDLK